MLCNSTATLLLYYIYTQSVIAVLHHELLQDDHSFVNSKYSQCLVLKQNVVVVWCCFVNRSPCLLIYLLLVLLIYLRTEMKTMEKYFN